MAIISEEQLTKMFMQYNPWWNEPSATIPEAQLHKRVAFHETAKTIEHESLRRFVLLSGMRRVGKTTILFQLIERLLAQGVAPKNILYVSFDNPIVKMVNMDAVLEAYDHLFPAEGERYLLFDEIQYADSWELWMKVIYDMRKDIKMVATGSASPILERGSTDSGVGRWRVLRVPPLSFYEYCELLELKERPPASFDVRPSDLFGMTKPELFDVIGKFSNLQTHFNRYLNIGGFPELVVSNGTLAEAQRTLREDVADKVIKRDVLSLFNVRSPLSMEKLFLYLCMNSTEIFSTQTAAKELESISASTIEEYLRFLEQSNLIYISQPTSVGSKAALKGRPKIYIADAAIRNAVLMIDDALADEATLGLMVETAVYQHVLSFYTHVSAIIGYYRKAKENQKEVDVVVEMPMRQKYLIEVKYRNNASLSTTDAIIALSSEENTRVAQSFVITKNLMDCGPSNHETAAPVFRIPAMMFLYMLGKITAQGADGKI